MNSGFKSHFKTFFTGLFLAITALVTVATSKYDPNKSAPPLTTLESREYYVASNCPNSLRQERISVVNGTISYPSNLQFRDFGLPLTQLDFANNTQISGEVRGYQMRCYYSAYPVRGGETTLDLYSCYENSRPICQVSFEPVLPQPNEIY